MATQTASPLDFIIQQGPFAGLWDQGGNVDQAITQAVQNAPDIGSRESNYANVLNQYFPGQSQSDLVNKILASRGWGGPGTGVSVNPDGTVSVNQDMGGDSFWKAPAAFAAAIGAGGLMGGAFGGLGAAPTADSIAAGITGGENAAGAMYGAGSGTLAGTGAGLTDAAWGVNPQGAGMNLNDVLNAQDSFWADPTNAGFSDLGNGTLNSVNALTQLGLNPAEIAGTYGLPSIPGGSSLLQKLLGNGNGGGILSGGSGLGALLGALAGGMGANSKPAGVTTTVQDIPDYLKPYQTMNLNSASNSFGAAGGGNALLPGALNQLNATINGNYVNPFSNPALAPYAKDLAGQTGSAYAARYGATPEALNNSGNQEGFTRAVTASMLPLYNNAYQTERSNQVNAASTAPAFANNYAGATLAPNLAFKNLYTGPQATSQPYFSNPFGGALSGALAGSQIGKLF